MNKQIKRLPIQTLRSDRISGLYMGYTHDNIWIPVRRISWDDEGYFYDSFLQGFEDNYEKIKGLVLNPAKGYTQTLKDKRVPAFLHSRIPHRSDSMVAYELLGLSQQKGDFIALVARNVGKKHGDRYDIFPELQPDNNGKYEFYFPIPGLATLIKEGNQNVRDIADNITLKAPVNLELFKDLGNIYHQGIRIGNCPQYLHYLLTNNPRAKYDLDICIINNHEFEYAYKIVAKLSICSTRSLYDLPQLAPLNFMPV